MVWALHLPHTQVPRSKSLVELRKSPLRRKLRAPRHRRVRPRQRVRHRSGPPRLRHPHRVVPLPGQLLDPPSKGGDGGGEDPVRGEAHAAGDGLGALVGGPGVQAVPGVVVGVHVQAVGPPSGEVPRDVTQVRGYHRVGLVHEGLLAQSEPTKNTRQVHVAKPRDLVQIRHPCQGLGVKIPLCPHLLHALLRGPGLPLQQLHLISDRHTEDAVGPQHLQELQHQGPVPVVVRLVAGNLSAHQDLRLRSPHPGHQPLPGLLPLRVRPVRLPGLE
mmetsp:Transcript_25394/g.55855  ORF Transcript_25394/g.55855 Transcript_25394/m.55855 type:complete len:273 (-) Transcript_25394:237-1055(-)